jgi:hypothetical protein
LGRRKPPLLHCLRLNCAERFTLEPNLVACCDQILRQILDGQHEHSRRMPDLHVKLNSGIGANKDAASSGDLEYLFNHANLLHLYSSIAISFP